MESLSIAVGGVPLCPTCSNKTRSLSGGAAYVRNTWPLSPQAVYSARGRGRARKTISALARHFKVSERHIYRLLAKRDR